MPTPPPGNRCQLACGHAPGRAQGIGQTQPHWLGARQTEHVKARIRAKVEQPFQIIKRQFGHVKARYLGLAMNTAQLNTLFALSNLWIAWRRLLRRL